MESKGTGGTVTPPPEQYAIDIPRRLPRASARFFDRQSLPAKAAVPFLDACAVALLAVALVALAPSPPDRVLLVPAFLTVTVPVRRKQRMNGGLLEDLGSIARRCLGAFALSAAVAALGGSGSSREALAAAAGALPLLVVARGVALSLERSRLRRGLLSPALVIGTGSTASKIISSLQVDLDYGLDVVGALGMPRPGTEALLGTRLLGPVEQAVDVARYRGVHTVIVASDQAEDPGIVGVIRALLDDGVNVWVVPRFFEVGADLPLDHVGAVPLVRLRESPRKRPGRGLKRALDVAVAACGLAASAPLFAFIALAIKLDSKGPVLFRQQRIGLDGKPFDILKFRTMVPRSRARSETEWAPEERHITRIGRLLRKTALDELPQLVNVLRGQLTLVGPRPERPTFVKIFEETYDGYRDRHRVPGGITGWAQIHGLRGDTSIPDRARFDNHYIENWSFARDLKILLSTGRIFFGRHRKQQTSEQDEQDGTTDLANVV